MPLTALRDFPVMQPFAYLDAGGSTAADVRVTAVAFAGPRPVTVGIVYQDRYVVQIGRN